MPKILLTNHNLIGYAGSELVTLDLAIEFQRIGWDVTVATFQLYGEIEKEFQAQNIKVINALHESLLQLEFDLVWGHHYPVLIKCLIEDDVKTKYLIISSLSPYEPLEAVPFFDNRANLILCNSEETKAAIIEYKNFSSTDSEKLFVFKNSVPPNWFNYNLDRSNSRLKKVAIISNHPPQEVLDIIDLLKLKNVQADLIGSHGSPKLVNINLLVEYDAVITIGRTTQHCMALGIPVFCYDRFGGPTWLTPDNFQLAEWFNYSGRCCYQKLSSEQIVDKLISGFSGAIDQTHFFQIHAIKNYSLGTNIETVLNHINILNREEKEYINFSAEKPIGKVGRMYRDILGSRETIQHKLEQSQSQLQQIQSKFQETQSELVLTQSKLQETQSELVLTQSKFQEILKTMSFRIIYNRILFSNSPIIKNIAKFLKYNEIKPIGYLKGNLESPSTHKNLINDNLLISGWLFNTESKIESLVFVRDNSLQETIEYGIQRLDVYQSYQDIECSEFSGFSYNLLLHDQHSKYVDIQIWAILETGEKICCFARRVNFQIPIQQKVISKKKDRINLFLFTSSVISKLITAYRQGKLPLNPKLWVYYLRRHYRQTQYIQNGRSTAILYSGIIHPWQTQDSYHRWIGLNALSEKLLNKMNEDAKSLALEGVKISIVVPVYNTPKHFLIEMIDSVKNQIYPNWELCLADDASTQPHTKELLQQLLGTDPRIKVVFRPENGHIIAATNSALEIATGDYIALLDHDDILSSDALLHVAECVHKHPEVEWIYTDEDKINELGQHFDPQMKGGWNPEMAITHNFTHHLTVIRKTLIEQVGRMQTGFEGAQDLDLFLRVSENTTPAKIQHIPHVCYHWRSHPGSTALQGTQKQYVFNGAYNAIEAAIQRRGLRAKPFLPPIAKKYGLCLYQIKWDSSLLAENSVTIVIPTKDRVDLLKKCISSLEKTVDSRFVKLIIVDDGSTEKLTHQYFDKLQEDNIFQCQIIKSERKIDVFNYARLVNLASNLVDTPYVLHLNNDIQAIEPGWLEDMVGWLSVDGVGVVGAKLLYPDKTIQHAGVVVGSHGGLADHLFDHLDQEEVGYICLPHAARNVSAVTGACLLTSIKLYRELGGFDENNFAIEYNDVDYCLRVIQSGQRIVYSPQSVLIHEASASRGGSYNPQEHINFISKYQRYIEPFFSKNLDIDSMTMAINPYSYSHLNRISRAKILFITHNLNLEGAPLTVYNYARYFTTQGGYDLCVISPEDGVLRQAYENLNIKVIIFENALPLKQENLETYHQRLRGLGEDLNLSSYDLIVCNTLISFWGIELANLFKLPTIWHIHESQSIDMSLSTFFGHASQEIIHGILPNCFINASRVIFQAEATRKIFHQFDVRDNFKTVPGGINLQNIEDFRNTHNKDQLRDKYGIDREHLVVVIVGTTCQRKGQLVFVEAIKELEKLCSDKFAKISFLIVGARTGIYLDSLNRKIEQLSLSNVSIYFETKDVYDFYALSDIFVCASYEESFPRVLLEAMAFQLKIVSTDVFGIPEMINDGCEGYLLQPGNPKDLAMAVYKCIVDPIASDRLARNAYSKVHRLFDNQNLLQQHWLLVKEVILSQR